MTDTSSIFATHSTPQQTPVTASALASPIVNGSLSDAFLQEEDEPYTIKCICSFQDDDGNTVYCEKCDTWQHIECYYPNGKKVPEIHNCADCEPRTLDAKRATERQKRLREQTDGGDRKSKRPSSKSHKKKIKEVDQTNGWHSHERHESASLKDHAPPAKRPKTSHRPSGSVSSINGAPVLTADLRKRAHSSAQSYPSPTKSPLNQAYPALPQYSYEFLHLYEDDQGQANLSMQDNFNTINVAGKLKSWLQDPMSLSHDTFGRQHHEVFTHSDAPLDPSSFPPVSQQTSMDSSIEIEGINPSWQILRLDLAVRKDELVGEIKGSIGLLRDYCLDDANRWQELRHPEPFVFFHPQLPIYIDSRREGTKFRYLRRSCRPNVTMKIFISSEGEYHYCFTAKEDIPAGAELTTTWFLDQAVLQHSNNIKEENSAEGEVDLPHPSVWASRVLANFGDCACDGTQSCMLAPLDRRRLPRLTDGLNNKHTNGRRKKAKSKQRSPPGRGRGSTSRAGSENIKAQDEDDPLESRSTSGSVRSKPRSREMTPSNAVDATLVTGLTDRERRKIAAAEKTFERLEQDQNGHRKKKRSSGGSNLNTPSLNTSMQLGHSATSLPNSPVVNKSTYVDASTSRQYSASPPLLLSNPRNNSNTAARTSGTPNTPALSSPLRQPSYVDSAMQTEEDNLTAESPPSKRRKFTPLTQRLLKKFHDDKRKYEELEQQHMSYSAGHALPSPVSPAGRSDVATLPSSAEKKHSTSEDAETKDIDSPTSASSPNPHASPSASRSSIDGSGKETSLLPPPPLPSQAAHTRKALQPPNGYPLQLSGLHLPSFPSASSNVTPSSVTPTSSLTQSPFSLASANSYVGLGFTTNTGNIVSMPSPVKKKLSLGDYMSRRSATSTNTPSVERTLSNLQATANSALDGPTLPVVPEVTTMHNPSHSLIEDAIAEGSIMAESGVMDADEDISMVDVVASSEIEPPSVPVTTTLYKKLATPLSRSAAEPWENSGDEPTPADPAAAVGQSPREIADSSVPSASA